MKWSKRKTGFLTQGAAVKNEPVGKTYRNVVFIVAAVLSVIYIMSYIPEILESRKTAEGTVIPWADMFRGLLVAFGTAFFASFVVDLAFTRWAIKDLRGTTTRALAEATKELYVLDGCKRAGVENVFPTRALFYEYLAEHLMSLNKGSVVKIIGISLRDFFREGPAEDGAVGKIRDAFEHTWREKNLRYRICLLDSYVSSWRPTFFQRRRRAKEVRLRNRTL